MAFLSRGQGTGYRWLMKTRKILKLSFFKKLSFLSFLLCFPVFLCQASAEEQEVDFTAFSLEELKNVEIISASKKPEKITDVPAAVFVITQEDIRRSGVTGIAEALRLAPGVQVARIGPADWAITIRGLNEEFSNNLLVLVDGRSVYSPVFSGVHWDIQDTVLEDIERIEVIRGPGAAVWGANAVNGVINIFTKNAKDTQGAQVVGLYGTEEESGSVRYGGTLGKETSYRTYLKFFNRDRFSGKGKSSWYENPDDNWESFRGGFRMDRDSEAGDSLMFEGEIFGQQYDTENAKFILASPYYMTEKDVSESAGGHILGRWQHEFSENSDTVLQCYYDHVEKNYGITDSCIDTFDIDFRHRFRFSVHDSVHEMIWGLGYRFISDEFYLKDGTEDSFQIAIDPTNLDQHLYSAFVQDRIELVPESLSLIVGSKFEHNDATGFEVQPNVRLLWTPGERHALWGAVSRAVRVPSRSERHLKAVNGILAPSYPYMKELLGDELGDTLIPDAPAVIKVLGNEGLSSEKLTAYEAGYRLNLTSCFRVDSTAFYYRYDQVMITAFGDAYLETAPRSHYVIPLNYENGMRGEAYGAEISGSWQLMADWRLTGAYSYLKTRLEWEAVADDIDTAAEEKSNPSSQFSLRSLMGLSKQLDFDVWLRYVSGLSENVDGYTAIDARLAWRPAETLEFSLVGQNLGDRQHQEFSAFEVERGVYFKIAWRF